MKDTIFIDGVEIEAPAKRLLFEPKWLYKRYLKDYLEECFPIEERENNESLKDYSNYCISYHDDIKNKIDKLFEETIELEKEKKKEKHAKKSSIKSFFSKIFKKNKNKDEEIEEDEFEEIIPNEVLSFESIEENEETTNEEFHIEADDFEEVLPKQEKEEEIIEDFEENLPKETLLGLIKRKIGKKNKKIKALERQVESQKKRIANLEANFKELDNQLTLIRTEKYKRINSTVFYKVDEIEARKENERIERDKEIKEKISRTYFYDYPAIYTYFPIEEVSYNKETNKVLVKR